MSEILKIRLVNQKCFAFIKRLFTARAQHFDGMAQAHDAFDRSNPLMKAYFIERSSIYAKLSQQREEVWANSQADEYFQYMQRRSDEAPPDLKSFYLQMMREIAHEMDQTTQFLTDINTNKKNAVRAPPLKVLDLCMAPGGFAAEVRDRLPPLTEIYGITLPFSDGGHDLLVEVGQRLRVEFVDITMLAAEMGATKTDIPLDHPDQNSFVFNRLYFGHMFDLILSDGKVLRTHNRQEYRERMEAVRLTVSQLIFALQHIKSGGTFVMLLHKEDTWSVLKQIYTFTKFSDSVQFFKPAKKHMIRSSFYLVAKGVKPEKTAALRALEEWKEIWKSTTFRFSTWNEVAPPEEEVKSLLEDYGDTFIKKFEPLWEIQSRALQRKLQNGFLTPV